MTLGAFFIHGDSQFECKQDLNMLYQKASNDPSHMKHLWDVINNLVINYLN